MIVYTVTYKKIGLFQRLHIINKVKGDGFVENEVSRYFILEDETRIEIPAHSMIFEFSKERFYSIKNSMENTAGQSVKIK